MNTSQACALFRRCLASGKSDDWRAFVDRYGWQIRNIVRLKALRCGLRLDEPDQQEMVQELYCRLLALPDWRFHGRTDAELWSFLSQVCRNLAVDFWRSWTAHKRLAVEKLPPENLRLPSQVAGPEERLLGKERRKHFLERCLEIVRCDRMVMELRVLRMAFLEGWTSREIARHFHDGLSAEQVDALVYRFRRHLAKDGIQVPRRRCQAVAAPV